MRARYCKANVVLNGVDISVHVNDDLLSLTYTDNEEDEADDLQIKVLDRDGKWLQKWLDSVVSDAAAGGEIISVMPDNGKDSDNSDGSRSSGGSGGSGNAYKVMSNRGLTVRTSASEKGKQLGKITYGTVVNVHRFSGEWANITFSGRSAWVKGKKLERIGTSSSGAGGFGTYSARRTVKGAGNSPMSKTARNAAVPYSDSESGEDWKIGDEVIANGRPQYDSWGIGKPGMLFTDYKGKVTHLNLKLGIPYPIHIDYLGWYALDQVQKVGGETKKPPERADSRGLKTSAEIICHNRADEESEERLDCGEFELDAITVDGPPQTVTIKATSLPYSCSIRQTAKSKSWESTTLSGIAKCIADANGMGLMWQSHYNPKYTRVEQYRKSDIAFLSKLCHDAGASLKATNNVLVIFDQSEYEKKSPARVIKFGEQGGYTRYRLGTGTNSTYTSCRVSYTTSNGTVISATEYAENYTAENSYQCLEIRQAVGSIAEAQLLAHKMLRLYNKYEYEASFTFPGDPALSAGEVVELVDFGAWNGKYIIKQAKHSLSRSGYTTQINLRKVLGAGDGTGVDLNGEVIDGDTDEEITKLAMQVIRGDWDNGQARYDKLTAAGHDYHKVQARVNQILSG